MIWGIIWIACGIFSAIVASSKGRSGFGWLVLGLIFGVFALLAVYACREDRQCHAKDWATARCS